MGNVETEIGGGDPRFPSTVWFQVTHSDGTGRDALLHRLIGLYWKPVYCTIRHAWSRSNEDAKDLTQEFFLRVVLEGSLLEKFSPERGSFRSLLKASIANFMRMEIRDAGRQKRGGGSKRVTLDGFDGDLSDLTPGDGALGPEEVFDAAWKKTVWARSIGLLEGRLRSQGRKEAFEVFRRYALDAGAEEASYSGVGAELGLTPDAVKNHLTRAREELRAIVVEVVREYVDNAEDLALEIRGLLGD